MIEKQYSDGSYSLVRDIVNFNPDEVATLDYKPQPADGWALIKHNKTKEVNQLKLLIS